MNIDNFCGFYPFFFFGCSFCMYKTGRVDMRLFLKMKKHRNEADFLGVTRKLQKRFGGQKFLRAHRTVSPIDSWAGASWLFLNCSGIVTRAHKQAVRLN